MGSFHYTHKLFTTTNRFRFPRVTFLSELNRLLPVVYCADYHTSQFSEVLAVGAPTRAKAMYFPQKLLFLTHLTSVRSDPIWRGMPTA